MNFNQSTAGVSGDNESRVKITLKALINLAQAASKLSLRQPLIKAQQSGGYVSRFKGRGMEFDEARLYQHGDDVRSIDWKVTARRGKPHTKLFREEREKPIFISVDNRPAMHFATRGVFKSVLAAQIAALLAWAAQYQGDRIGGQIFNGGQCLELKPKNGKTGVLRLLNALVNTDYDSTNAVTLDQVFARLVQHARPGSQVYIISDFRGMDAKAETFLAKLAQHCYVALVMIYDPLEKALPNQGRYRFTDSVKEVVVDAADQQKLLAYQQRFAYHVQYLQTLASKLGLLFLECSTLQDPVQCLKPRYL